MEALYSRQQAVKPGTKVKVVVPRVQPALTVGEQLLKLQVPKSVSCSTTGVAFGISSSRSLVICLIYLRGLFVTVRRVVATVTARHVQF